MRKLVLFFAVASLACAPAPRDGDTVHIADESAIIIWDAASKTQHFIRRASFETKAKDFGFLVPTPSVPELKEAQDAAFPLLARLTDPPFARSSRGPVELAKSAPPAAAAPQVVVVAKEKVAGYDAAILKANDAGALDAWLKDNAYASSPELVEWYRPYVAANWIITAFKIAGDGERKAVASAVRMSFHTEKPFFPYREPASKGTSQRLLTVYFLGNERPQGSIGDKRGAWPARTTWSGTMESRDRQHLLQLLNLPDVAPAATRLTRFRDESTQRLADGDLFFSPASDQSEVRHLNAGEIDEILAKNDRTNLLVGVALAAVVLVAILLDRRRRRAARK